MVFLSYYFILCDVFSFQERTKFCFGFSVFVKAGHTLVLKVKGVASNGHSDQQSTVTQAVCTLRMFRVTSKLEEYQAGVADF